MASLDRAAVSYLRQAGQVVACGDGEFIVRRGQSGQAFYVVLSGTVEVLLAAGDGGRLPLARLTEGETFGEMSLLTGEPISADVVAKGDASILAYPAERFQAAMAECAALRNHVLARLCNDLRATSTKAWGLFQRAEALGALMLGADDDEPVVAESARMRAVVQRIEPRDAVFPPLLITGEAGAGKLFFARKIHRRRCQEGRALIVVDCRRLEESQLVRLLFGSGEDRRFDESPAQGASLHQFGAIDLADGGTLVLQHVEAMGLSCQAALGRYLEARGTDAPAAMPRAGVIATASADLPSLARAGRFDARLLERLSAQTLEIPPMRDRRRDILPLAALFLQRRDRKLHEAEHRFHTSAEHALLSAKFRHRNAAELREAVELAALFADGSEIRSQHVFTGPKDSDAQAGYDLTATRPVRWVVAGVGLRLLRAGMLAVFGAIAITCLAAPGAAAGRVANALVWGLWWPALILLFLLVGRVWCTVCPISAAGRAARRLGGLDLQPPEGVKKHSVWLGIAAFLAIVWAEHVFNMTAHPFATGVLLLTLTAAAVAFCVLFQREVWCRYVCPLGCLGASLSAGATLHVRANPDVCATQCKTHECYKGGPGAPPCPVFHHPMYARDGQFCKLCLNCLRSCRHNSARLYLHAPLRAIWNWSGAAETLVPFALAAFFLVMLMLASRQSAWLAGALPYTALAIAGTALGAAFYFVLRWILTPGRNGESALLSPVAFCLLLLAAGPLMAFHLGNIPALASARVYLVSSPSAVPAAGGGVSMLLVLQLAAIALAAAVAAIALWRTAARFAGQGVSLGRPRWAALLGIWAAYTAVATALMLLKARGA